MSANQLALAIRVPANRITSILRGDRAISAEIALRLGRYLGTGHEAVEDYLETCAKIGKEPQRAYSGRVIFRVSPETHCLGLRQ